MSTSSLYAVFRTKAVEVREYRNGHGTGPLIWGHLLEHYLQESSHAWLFDERASNRLWELAHAERVPLSLRACLAFTLDYAVIPAPRVAEMGRLIAEGGDILSKAAPVHVNHFPAIGRDMVTLKLDPRAAGVGLTCTSVADIWSEWDPKRKPTFNCYDYVMDPAHA